MKVKFFIIPTPAAPGAQKEINDWLASHTSIHIHHILQTGTSDLMNLTVVVSIWYTEGSSGGSGS